MHIFVCLILHFYVIHIPSCSSSWVESFFRHCIEHIQLLECVLGFHLFCHFLSFVFAVLIFHAATATYLHFLRLDNGFPMWYIWILALSGNNKNTYQIEKEKKRETQKSVKNHTIKY